MATRSGFSKGWQGFVDHKWSKKSLGASFTVLLSGTHYQEFECASGCSQNFLNDIAVWRQGRLRKSHLYSNEVLLGTRSIAALKGVLILSTIVLGMSTTTGLADLLFGRTRGAVLALLYGRADQSFYTREIAREVDASVGAVQRELENLSKVELILRKSVGSQVFYQANRDTPIFPEMQALINKTIGIFGVLRSALHPLSKRIVAAFVYGSVAREEETAQSDVDLMVVGKATLDEVLSRLSTAEKGIGRSINPTVYSLAEFKSKLAAGNHFLTSVLKGQKVFLVGDEDELRKVGRVRLAKARTN